MSLEKASQVVNLGYGEREPLPTFSFSRQPYTILSLSKFFFQSLLLSEILAY